MSELESHYKGFKTKSARWARFGPYYAMFPVDFAFSVIDKYQNVAIEFLTHLVVGGQVFLQVVFLGVKAQE